MSTSAEPAAQRRDPARREQLLDAADRVLSSRAGSVSVAAIAEDAGVTKPVLYRHFGDKAGLYRALAERHAEQLVGELRVALRTRGGLRARVRATVSTYLAALERRPDAYRFVMHQAAEEEPAVAGYVALVQLRLAEELALGLAQQLGVAPDSARARVWAHGVVAAVRGTGEWWLEAPAGPAREQVVDELTELLVAGLGGQS